jgi:cytochrome b561
MTQLKYDRYTSVAIALHWIMALLILGMIFGGWVMSSQLQAQLALPKDQRDGAQMQQIYQFFQIHKALGMTILALTVVRLAWRLTHKPPALPNRMPAWERRVAIGTHVLFYALMVLMPFAGWAYVSAGYSVSTGAFFSSATTWFGVFEIPHLPFVAGQDEPARKQIARNAMSAHGRMAWAMLVLALLHIGATLKHHFVDRDEVLARMAPILKPLTRMPK